jgi:hypothetical protein
MRVGIPGQTQKWPADQGSPHTAHHETGARRSAFSAVPKGQNRAKYALPNRMPIPTDASTSPAPTYQQPQGCAYMSRSAKVRQSVDVYVIAGSHERHAERMFKRSCVVSIRKAADQAITA